MLRHHAAALGIVLSALVAIAAVESAIGVAPLAEQLAILEQRLPGLFRLHMMASGLALLLLPLILLLRHRRSAHRRTGRVGAALLFIGATTSLPAAVQSEAVLVARAGFFIQGVLCLTFLIGAIRAVRAHDVQQHAQLMLRVCALVFGAVALRVMMAVATTLGLPFDASYAAAAWLSWVLPLSLVLIWSPARAGAPQSIPSSL